MSAGVILMWFILTGLSLVFVVFDIPKTPVHPAQPGFWFVMSMALIAGFILAYPMNWWLVGNGLKHGMFAFRQRLRAAMPAERNYG